jgi:hypothetical protein
MQTLGRPRRGWDDNTRMHLRKQGGLCTGLIWLKIRKSGGRTRYSNFGLQKKAENFLTEWLLASYEGLLHGVSQLAIPTALMWILRTHRIVKIHGKNRLDSSWPTTFREKFAGSRDNKTGCYVLTLEIRLYGNPTKNEIKHFLLRYNKPFPCYFSWTQAVFWNRIRFRFLPETSPDAC